MEQYKVSESEKEQLSYQQTKETTQESIDNILSKLEIKKLRRKERKKQKKIQQKPKEARPRWTNREHQIPKIRWGSSHNDNFKQSDINAHRWKHMYLWVQLPHEQLNTILEDNYKTLHPQTREMIVEEIQVLIEYYLKYDEFYNEKCFKDKRRIPNKL